MRIVRVSNLGAPRSPINPWAAACGPNPSPPNHVICELGDRRSDFQRVRLRACRPRPTTRRPAGGRGLRARKNNEIPTDLARDARRGSPAPKPKFVEAGPVSLAEPARPSLGLGLLGFPKLGNLVLSPCVSYCSFRTLGRGVVRTREEQRGTNRPSTRSRADDNLIL